MSTDPLTTTLLAGGFTVTGVALKVSYDAWIERRRNQDLKSDRFINERRQAYDDFLETYDKLKQYDEQLHELVVGLADRTLGSHQDLTEEQAAFMDRASPLTDLVACLDRIRRVAHTLDIIRAAEVIIRLEADKSDCEDAILSRSEPQDRLIWKLLSAFQADRLREFTYAYRADLGLGPPKRAEPTFPVIDRGQDINIAESHARFHLRHVRERARMTGADRVIGRRDGDD